MMNLLLKLVLFSLIFFIVVIIPEVLELLKINVCGDIHSSNSVLCDLIIYAPLYTALILGVVFGWKLKPYYAAFAFLIPMPFFIYYSLEWHFKGHGSQIFSNLVDLMQSQIFQYSIPCLVVALTTSFLVRRDLSNAP